MYIKKPCRPIPDRGNDNCFACSSDNPAGLKMKFSTDEESVFSCLTVPDHLSGSSNMVHGGVISTILDEIMGRSALQFVKKVTLTKSICIDFLKPLYIGDKLKAEGKLREIKNEREAVMESFLFNSKGELCARATGIFATFTPEAVKKLGIIDEPILKGVENLIEG